MPNTKVHLSIRDPYVIRNFLLSTSLTCFTTSDYPPFELIPIKK